MLATGGLEHGLKLLQNQMCYPRLIADPAATAAAADLYTVQFSLVSSSRAGLDARGKRVLQPHSHIVCLWMLFLSNGCCTDIISGRVAHQVVTERYL